MAWNAKQWKELILTKEKEVKAMLSEIYSEAAGFKNTNCREVAVIHQDGEVTSYTLMGGNIPMSVYNGTGRVVGQFRNFNIDGVDFTGDASRSAYMTEENWNDYNIFCIEEELAPSLENLDLWEGIKEIDDKRLADFVSATVDEMVADKWQELMDQLNNEIKNGL